MNEIDEYLKVVHHFPTAGNPVYVRQMRAPAGLTIGSHKHLYDHYSILCSGKALAEYAGVKVEYDAPAVLTIPKGVEHRITAITDIVWFCVHGVSEDEIGHAGINEALIGG